MSLTEPLLCQFAKQFYRVCAHFWKVPANEIADQLVERYLQLKAQNQL
ncbi:hypothetical protein [Nostoc sp.]